MNKNPQKRAWYPPKRDQNSARATTAQLPKENILIPAQPPGISPDVHPTIADPPHEAPIASQRRGDVQPKPKTPYKPKNTPNNSRTQPNAQTQSTTTNTPKRRPRPRRQKGNRAPEPADSDQPKQGSTVLSQPSNVNPETPKQMPQPKSGRTLKTERQEIVVRSPHQNGCSLEAFGDAINDVIEATVYAVSALGNGMAQLAARQLNGLGDANDAKSGVNRPKNPQDDSHLRANMDRISDEADSEQRRMFQEVREKWTETCLKRKAQLRAHHASPNQLENFDTRVLQMWKLVTGAKKTFSMVYIGYFLVALFKRIWDGIKQKYNDLKDFFTKVLRLIKGFFVSRPVESGSLAYGGDGLALPVGEVLVPPGIATILSEGDVDESLFEKSGELVIFGRGMGLASSPTRPTPGTTRE